MIFLSIIFVIVLDNICDHLILSLAMCVYSCTGYVMCVDVLVCVGIVVHV